MSPATPSSSWTTATPTAPWPRCAATECVFSCDTSRPSASLEKQRRWRHAAGRERAVSHRRRRRSAHGPPLVLADRPVATAAPLPAAAVARGRAHAQPARRRARSTRRRTRPARPDPRHRSSTRRCRTARTSSSSRRRRAAPADAGARTRRGRDPLVRHRHLRRGGRRGAATAGPTARRWRVDVPGGTCQVDLARGRRDRADRPGRAGGARSSWTRPGWSAVDGVKPLSATRVSPWITT